MQNNIPASGAFRLYEILTACTPAADHDIGLTNVCKVAVEA